VFKLEPLVLSSSALPGTTFLAGRNSSRGANQRSGAMSYDPFASSDDESKTTEPSVSIRKPFCC
jgi:hypothetical protein